MRGTPRCRGLHRALVVEEFNSLGAVVSCLLCDLTFQMGEDSLNNHYVPFEHTAPEGPEEDISLFLLASFIYGEKHT